MALKSRPIGRLDHPRTMQQEINDVGNGRWVAAVIDAEGNVLGFIQDA